jgi:hypothetical protein
MWVLTLLRVVWIDEEDVKAMLMEREREREGGR